MELRDDDGMSVQRWLDLRGKQRNAILCALASVNVNDFFAPIDIFEAETHAFTNPHAGAVNQPSHQAFRTPHQGQNTADLIDR